MSEIKPESPGFKLQDEAWILADLQRSGLTPAEIAAAGIELKDFDKKRLKELLGYANFAKHSVNVSQSYLIPYPVISGEAPDYKFGRLKINGTLGGAKYLSPKVGHVKHPSHLYITEAEAGRLSSPKRPILLVEGEKKALSAAKALASAGVADDYCVIGVAGVSQWQSAPEWAGLKIRLQGRDLYIVFDADAESNADVRREQLKLWAWGLEKGCRVFLVSWPPESGKGIDDFIVAGGSLIDLLSAARRRAVLDFFKDRPITEIIDALRRVKLTRITAQGLALQIRQYWGDYSKGLLVKEILNEKIPVKKAAEQKAGAGASRTWPDRAKEYLKLLKDKNGKLLMRRWNGAYYVYRHRRYEQIQDELAAAYRQEFVAKNYPDLATSAGNKNLEVNLAFDLLVDNSRVQSLPCWVSTLGARETVKSEDRPDPNTVIPLENGLLVLSEDGQKHELTPHTPDFFSTNNLPFAYDPEATCPRFKEFIAESADPAYIDLLQEWGGICMTPITRFQRFVLLHGLGGNGKGVFTNILSAVIGDDNISSLPIEALNQDKQQLEGLIGKYLNIAGEIKMRADIDEGTLKAITGDDYININPKHLKSYKYRPRCKLMFSANKVPSFPDRSDAVWRRIMLIPFKNRPTRVDFRLEERLKQEELPGIFNWFLEGLSRLLHNNEFSIPEAMIEEQNRRRRYGDPVLMFLSDYVSEIPCGSMPAKVKGSDFYQAYEKWCLANGQAKYKFSAVGFLEELNRICEDGVYRKTLKMAGTNTKCIAFDPSALDNLHKRLQEFNPGSSLSQPDSDVDFPDF